LTTCFEASCFQTISYDPILWILLFGLLHH
jgi:hypothetical protein